MVDRVSAWLSAIGVGLLLASGAVAGAPLGSTVAEAPVPAPAVDRTLVIDGVGVRVREQGPRGGKPIVLIHGFSFSLESFDAWAADLARDHRVIRFDLAGHGLSDPDPRQRYGTADRVAMLAVLMDAVGAPRATLVGNSFGGLLAWRLAAEQPARVEQLILIDSAAFSINGVDERPAPIPAATRGFLLAPTAAGVAFTAGLIYADPTKLPSGRLEQMRATIARNGPELVAHLERFTLPAPEPLLARVAAPTLILWGALDKVVPVEQATRLRDAIPGARLVVYDGVGHAPHEEIPARSLADARKFLAETR